MTVATATCGETQAVTAGAGAWDTAVCWLPADHDGACDYQVEAPEQRLGHLQTIHSASGSAVRLVRRDCHCGYVAAAHVNGRCPGDELAVRAAWGDH